MLGQNPVDSLRLFVYAKNDAKIRHVTKESVSNMQEIPTSLKPPL